MDSVTSWTPVHAPTKSREVASGSTCGRSSPRSLASVSISVPRAIQSGQRVPNSPRARGSTDSRIEALSRGSLGSR